MPSVTVTATNNATGVMSTAISNDAGVYVFPSLLPGPYRVTATQAGFRTRTFTDVQLGLRSRNRVRLESPVAW
jgi:protocatechuate 3,4-dioxygenase beta subunit